MIWNWVVSGVFSDGLIKTAIYVVAGLLLVLAASLIIHRVEIKRHPKGESCFIVFLFRFGRT